MTPKETRWDGLHLLLDPDLAKKDGKYQAVHEKLVRYFRVWPCPDPEDLADEAILRVLLAVYDGKRGSEASVAPDESPWDELLSLLDPDPVKAPEQFHILFQRLIRYFAGGRCEDPENLAGETIFRVCKAIKTGQKLTGKNAITKYAFGVANNVRLEGFHGMPEGVNFTTVNDPIIESMFAYNPEDPARAICLKQCWQRFSLGERALVIVYRYFHSKRELAELLGISYSSLHRRVEQIKSRFWECAGDC
ncbi:MAG: hypothetical protein MOB07_10725 [Acidobacteria bacterium]|nr:hypothetical protein [Acidobacteriota bacterium]